MPKVLLHLEGAAVLAAAVFAYHLTQGSWLTFGLLFFVPDVSMLGYLANPRLGAITYNAVHTYIGPLALAAFAWAAHHTAVLAIALIWIAHLGFDRMLGYGLKYPTRFQDTHLSAGRL